MADTSVWQAIFATPIQDFDMAIPLNPVALPHAHRSVPGSSLLEAATLQTVPHQAQAVLQHIPAGLPLLSTPPPPPSFILQDLASILDGLLQP